LTGEWVLVSTGRTARPWSGETAGTPSEPKVAYDPACYLCPGNLRASGDANPEYRGVNTFTNDFPALRPESGAIGFDDGLFRAEATTGTCRVICYSPYHHLSLGELPTADIRAVVDGWALQTAELGERFPWVQVFENRGAAMGASNQHPHGQVWASSAIPQEGLREDSGQGAYFARGGPPSECSARSPHQERPRLGSRAPWSIKALPDQALAPDPLVGGRDRHRPAP
jgi:UDPglucose--hexose-1-phosphate uridylyltransferase